MALIKGKQILSNSINIDKLNWENYTVGDLLNGISANKAPVNKEYADSIAAGLDYKESVKVATVSDLGASYSSTGSSGLTSGSFTSVPNTIDDIILAVNDRILVKDQIDQTQNGIYIVTDIGAGGPIGSTSQIQRAIDHDATPANEVSGGNSTFVESGTINAAKGYVLEGAGILTLNTDNLIWIQFSAQGSYIGDNGIVISGQNISIDLAADSGLEFSTGQLRILNSSGIIRDSSGLSIDLSYISDNIASENLTPSGNSIQVYSNLTNQLFIDEADLTPLTASNGITRAVNAFELGGLLNKNTNIDLDNFSFSISDTVNTLSNILSISNTSGVNLNGNGNSLDLNILEFNNLNVEGNAISIKHNNATSNQIQINQTSSIVSSGNGNEQIEIADTGIIFNITSTSGAEYSIEPSNYQAQSLVTKTYVDNEITNKVITAGSGTTPGLDTTSVNLGGVLTDNYILDAGASNLNVFLGFNNNIGEFDLNVNDIINISSDNDSINLFSGSGINLNSEDNIELISTLGSFNSRMQSSFFDNELFRAISKSTTGDISEFKLSEASNVSESGIVLKLGTTPTPPLLIEMNQNGNFVNYSYGFTFNDQSATPIGIEYSNDYSANFTSRSLVDKGYVDNQFISNSLTFQNGLTLNSNTVELGGTLISDVSLSRDEIGSQLFEIIESNTSGAVTEQYYQGQRFISDSTSLNGDSNNLLFFTKSNESGLGAPTFGNNSSKPINIGSYLRLQDSNSNSEKINLGYSNSNSEVNFILNNTGIDLTVQNALNITSFNINSIGAEFSAPAASSPGIRYSNDYSANFTARSLVDKGYVDNLIGNGFINGEGTTFIPGTNPTFNLGGSFIEDISILNTIDNKKFEIVHNVDDGGENQYYTSFFQLGNTNGYSTEAVTGIYASGENTFSTSLSEIGTDLSISGSLLEVRVNDSGNSSNTRLGSVNNSGDFTGISTQATSAGRVSIEYNDSSLSSQILLNSIGITVSGAAGFEGIQYDSNYAPNFTSRSLVDKQYVDGLVNGPGSGIEVVNGSINLGGTLTQDTMITKSGVNDYFAIGDAGVFGNNSVFAINESSGSNWISSITRSGTDTDQFMVDINISQDPSSIKPAKYVGLVNSSEFYNAASFNYFQNSISADLQSQMTMGYYLNDADGFRFIISRQEGNGGPDYPFTIEDRRSNTVGLEYLNDYSNDFTSRSLVDKQYVDNAVLGVTLNNGSGTTYNNTNQAIDLGGTITSDVIFNNDGTNIIQFGTVTTSEIGEFNIGATNSVDITTTDINSTITFDTNLGYTRFDNVQASIGLKNISNSTVNLTSESVDISHTEFASFGIDSITSVNVPARDLSFWNNLPYGIAVPLVNDSLVGGGELVVGLNSTGTYSVQSTDENKKATIIGSRNSLFLENINNSVIVGGTNLIADTDNTLFTENISAYTSIISNYSDFKNDGTAYIELTEDFGYSTINLGEKWSLKTFDSSDSPVVDKAGFSINNLSTGIAALSFLNDQITLNTGTAISGGQGIQYFDDYSSQNITNDRWLVDKGYVDNQISNSNLNSGNAITVNSGNINLGGTFNQNTSINTSTFNLDISSNDGFNFTVDPAGNNQVDGFANTGIYYVDPTTNNTAWAAVHYEEADTPTAILAASNSTFSVQSNVEVNSEGVSLFNKSISDTTVKVGESSVVISNNMPASFEGATYNLDYSANFVDRSLVDKGYVDNLINATGNGITWDSVNNNINLGGTLNQNTNVIGNFDLNFGSSISPLNNFSIFSSPTTNEVFKIESQDGLGQIFASITTENTISSENSSLELTTSGLSLGNNSTNSSININSGNPGNNTQISLGNNDGNSFRIIDNRSNINKRGIIYDDDYSSFFIDRSLVDKGYVDSQILGSSITAGNGLTNNLGVFNLGGTLSGPVNISGGDNSTIFNINLSNSAADRTVDFNLDANNSIQLLSTNSSGLDIESGLTINTTTSTSELKYNPTGSTDQKFISVAPSSISITNINSTGLTNQLTISDTEMLITDSINSRGLQYSADYSANYNIRSLVDKDYVDTSITAAAVGGIDDILSLNQNLSADRTININGNSLFLSSDSNNIHEFNVNLSDNLSSSYEEQIRILTDPDPDEAGITIKSSDTANNVNSELLLKRGNAEFKSIVSPGNTSFVALLVGGGVRLGHGNAGLRNNIDINSSGGIEIRDELGSLGMSYANDYLANNLTNDRWIVDKGYVDSQISNTSITAGNGITNSTNTFNLGGILSDDVNFDGAFNFSLGTTTPITDFIVNSNNNISLNGDTDGLNNTISLGTSGINLNSGTGDIIITDSKVTTKGIEYAANYSIGFTDRSLIDKGFTKTLSNGTYGAVYIVDPSGNNLTAEVNSLTNTYATINAAATAASSFVTANGQTAFVYVKLGTYNEDNITRNKVDMYFEDNTVVYTSNEGVSVLSDAGPSFPTNGGSFNIFGNGTFANLNFKDSNSSDTINISKGSIIKIEAKDIGNVQIGTSSESALLEINNSIIRWGSNYGNNINKTITYNNCTLLHPIHVDSSTDDRNHIYNYNNCNWRLLTDYSFVTKNPDLWVITDSFNSTTIDYIDPIVSVNPIFDDLLSGYTSSDNLLTNYTPTDFRNTYTSIIEGNISTDTENTIYNFRNNRFILEKDFTIAILILQQSATGSQSLFFEGCTIVERGNDNVGFVFSGSNIVSEPIEFNLRNTMADITTLRKSYSTFIDLKSKYQAVDPEFGGLEAGLSILNVTASDDKKQLEYDAITGKLELIANKVPLLQTLEFDSNALSAPNSDAEITEFFNLTDSIYNWDDLNGDIKIYVNGVLYRSGVNTSIKIPFWFSNTIGGTKSAIPTVTLNRLFVSIDDLGFNLDSDDYFDITFEIESFV